MPLLTNLPIVKPRVILTNGGVNASGPPIFISLGGAYMFEATGDFAGGAVVHIQWTPTPLEPANWHNFTEQNGSTLSLAGAGRKQIFNISPSSTVRAKITSGGANTSITVSLTV